MEEYDIDKLYETLSNLESTKESIKENHSDYSLQKLEYKNSIKKYRKNLLLFYKKIILYISAYSTLLITPFLIKPISKQISGEDLTCSLTITEYEKDKEPKEKVYETTYNNDKDKVYIKLIEPWRYDGSRTSKYYDVTGSNLLLDDYLDYDITSMSPSFEREEYYIGNIDDTVDKPTQRLCTYTYDKDTIKNEKYNANLYLLSSLYLVVLSLSSIKIIKDYKYNKINSLLRILIYEINLLKSYKTTQKEINNKALLEVLKTKDILLNEINKYEELKKAYEEEYNKISLSLSDPRELIERYNNVTSSDMLLVKKSL